MERGAVEASDGEEASVVAETESEEMAVDHALLEGGSGQRHWLIRIGLAQAHDPVCFLGVKEIGFGAMAAELEAHGG